MEGAGTGSRAGDTDANSRPDEALVDTAARALYDDAKAVARDRCEGV